MLKFSWIRLIILLYMSVYQSSVNWSSDHAMHLSSWFHFERKLFPCWCCLTWLWQSVHIKIISLAITLWQITKSIKNFSPSFHSTMTTVLWVKLGNLIWTYYIDICCCHTFHSQETSLNSFEVMIWKEKPLTLLVQFVCHIL